MFHHFYSSSFSPSYIFSSSTSTSFFDPSTFGHHVPPSSFPCSTFQPSFLLPCSYSSESLSMSSSFHEPVRSVPNTGNLQYISGSFSSAEASSSDGSTTTSSTSGRVGRYSAEERRERIERYRRKRNQRKFQKKITYACRKTLADHRPRVRGRFARNGKAESTGNGFEYWKSCCDTAESSSSKWQREMQTAMSAADQKVFDDDEDLWGSLELFAMNLCSSLS
ncbi:hypothetical protein HPP92_017405 [Vanilla planifolia]|uniref:CCT domain-containing protein n=1 Tax=Vanilla planifolia TaxID=51239 RepID=A0A835QFC5_VANPL|nr:hypothetical protein HPP92_017405 [Vanilla planifolia]